MSKFASEQQVTEEDYLALDKTATANSIRQANEGKLLKKPLKVGIIYPWLSPVLSVAVVAILITLERTEFMGGYGFPSVSLTVPAMILLGLFVLVLILLDLRRFIVHRRKLQQKIEQLEQELQYAWQSKKQLQQRTHLYSDHADKLKRFISDKLLEQIEYDEKFLHFKSIAAEVRHNGVISYDIVRSALEQAVSDEKIAFSASGVLSDTHRFGLPNNPNSGNQQALEAMKYLWDLLDLSTADNISLHIGNYLIECEEVYYQAELNKQYGNNTELINCAIFLPSHALIKALAPYWQPRQIDYVIAQLNTMTAINPQADTEESAHVFQEDDQFRIDIKPSGYLLGNENHVILLLENLVKNAQFFSTKTRFRQKTDRIALLLFEQLGCVHISIYNRGPHVSEADKEQIFHLGFSTRRVKEHHGKGLGLFFVNEIVKGYQGKIQIDNIVNRENTLTVRMAFGQGDIVTKVLATRVLDQRPQVQEVGQGAYSDCLQWAFDGELQSIEVSSTTTATTHIFTEVGSDEIDTWLDPENPFMPEWAIEVSQKAKKCKIKFTVLDIKGARFTVILPTAEARLSGEDLDLFGLEPAASPET